MVDALVSIRRLAGHDNRNLLITHDPDMWTLHPSVTTKHDLHVDEVQLAPGAKSRLEAAAAR